MRKPVSIILAATSTAGALLVALGVYLHTNSQKEEAVRRLKAENSSLSNQLATADGKVADGKALIAGLEQRIAALEAREAKMDENKSPAPAPVVTTDESGRKSLLFSQLRGPDDQIIGRNVRFRELLGNTKFSFRTAEGVRYYDISELHPNVIRELGYDPAVLTRRAAEEVRRAELLGRQVQFQQELRAQAAVEHAERERAQAERIKAEAALREAEARERLALAAERAATNPPKPQRIIQKVVVGVPYNPNQPNPDSN